MAITAALVMAASMTACSTSSGGSSVITTTTPAPLPDTGLTNTFTNFTFTFDGIKYTGTYTGGTILSKFTSGDGTFTGESKDGSTIQATGVWGDSELSGGKGEVNVTYKSGEVIAATLKGWFVKNVLTGDAEITFYYSKEFAAENGIDRIVCKGEADPDSPTYLAFPYSYTAYKDNAVVSEGIAE